MGNNTMFRFSILFLFSLQLSNCSLDSMGCRHSLFNHEENELRGLPGIIPWRPLPNKYLLMDCFTGQLTNRIYCIKHSIIYAALLNRTLVIPLKREETLFKYDYRLVVDFPHLRNCVGRHKLITLEEYVESHNGQKIIVDELKCWKYRQFGCPIERESEHSPPRRTNHDDHEYIPDFQLRMVSDIGFKPDIRLKEGGLLPNITLHEFLLEFGYLEGDVLLMGDVFKGRIWDIPNLYLHNDIPVELTSDCTDARALLRPHKALIETAKSFIRQYIGDEPFLALHLRRGDFRWFCRTYLLDGCYYPLSQVAECISKEIKESGIYTLYLASNANDNELYEIHARLRTVNNHSVKIIQMPKYYGKSGFAYPLKSIDQEVDRVIRITVEKLVCTFAHVFVGAFRSTFTTDIQRLRYGFGTASCRDSYLCDGEKAWGVWHPRFLVP